jgi:ribonuclease BN (tRNA processing enzyme)
MSNENEEDKISEISGQCDIHESFLKELLRGRYACLQGYLGGGLRFGIARRWNSWYPSYFNVEGGCYVLIPGDLDTQYEKNIKDESIGVIVIDPGFKFIDILRTSYQIEPQDIRTVIVTHFHPDHMAGLLEYATIMNTSKQACNIYLNETAFNSFKTLQNAFISVNELRDGQIQEIMRYTTYDKKVVRVSVKAINVHHNELGNQHRSLGLILETQLILNSISPNENTLKTRIGILGDTDGNEEYIPFYVKNFSHVDILVLHLGTFSDKKFGRGGKHLYITGVRQILKQMGEHFISEKKNDRKVVVLSEFGLEMADDDTLYHKLQPFIESHSWRLPLIYAHLYLEQNNSVSNGPLVSNSGSHIFARAILDLLEKINFNGKESTSKTTVNRKEADEILLALALQFIAIEFTNDDFPNFIIELTESILRFIAKEKKEKLVDRLPVEAYISYLRKNLDKCDCLSHVIDFVQIMVDSANFGINQISSNSRRESFNQLIYRLGDNLENPGNILYYIDKLPYIFKFGISKGIPLYENSRKRTQDFYSLDNNGGLQGLEYLWVGCMVGIYLLQETLASSFMRKQGESSEHLLIKIGSFFQDGNDNWANVLIGDIGCTFGINPPNDRNDTERKHGVFIQSPNGQWVIPSKVKCIFDNENNRILYDLTPDNEIH